MVIKLLAISVVFVGVLFSINLFSGNFLHLSFQNLKCRAIIWHKYQNPVYHFRLQYPDSWTVNEFPQPNVSYEGLPQILFAMTISQPKPIGNLTLQIQASSISLQEKSSLDGNLGNKIIQKTQETLPVNDKKVYFTQTDDIELLTIEMDTPPYFTQYFFTFGDVQSTEDLDNCSKWIGKELLLSIQLTN